MKIEYRFQFPLPNGLHARPASHLQEVTNQFASQISLVNHRTSREADAKSVLSLVGADVKADDPCSIHFSGEDANLAREVVSNYLEKEFLHCDQALSQTALSSERRFLPRSLRRLVSEDILNGSTISPGIGRGTIVVIKRRDFSTLLQEQTAQSPLLEEQALDRAIAAVSEDLERQAVKSSRSDEAEVIAMHRNLLRDKTFLGKVHGFIRQQGKSAGLAIVAAQEDFCRKLRESENLYLRERVLDIEDICQQLLVVLCGGESGAPKIQLSEPSICVAESLTPGQFLGLDRRYLKGLVLESAGATSHTAILARSFNIPTVGGVNPKQLHAIKEREAVVDANRAIVIPVPTEAISRFYDREIAKFSRMQLKHAGSGECATTADGHRIEIAANITSAEEAGFAFESGAEGIGLFRTEMLFMDREEPPSEEEQTQIYSEVVRQAGGRPVIIRTFDIGGDKPVAYLGLEREANPFLGYRGARIYEEFSSLFNCQIRSLLRAAELGPVKVMFPMISSVEEFRSLKGLVENARRELEAAGQTAARADIELGLMLEVPSVAFQMDQLCKEADFFSIGTNDLLQYFTAVDRDNSRVATLASAKHPGFIRLLQSIIGKAREHGKWIGLCGQAGEDLQLLPILVGLGLNEISVPAPKIGALKFALHSMRLELCQGLVEKATACTTREEIDVVLGSFGLAQTEDSPMISPELVLLDSDARTKEDAIRELCDALHENGRTASPDLLEEEIWAREEAYSTGFGHGFAIPHCKSAHLASNSIVVLKTRPDGPGISWGSLDGNPVQVAVLLAIRADQQGNEHLKTLAKLSRQLMREEFRDRLLSESAQRAIAESLQLFLNGT